MYARERETYLYIRCICVVLLVCVQGALVPTASHHLRKRVTRSMWEKNGFVNFWSEFLIAHVAVLYDFSFDYADTRLADEVCISRACCVCVCVCVCVCMFGQVCVCVCMGASRTHACAWYGLITLITLITPQKSNHPNH